MQLPHDSWPETLNWPGMHAVQFHERPLLHVPASHFVTWVAAAFLLVLSPGPHGKQPPVCATGAYLPCVGASCRVQHTECSNFGPNFMERYGFKVSHEEPKKDINHSQRAKTKFLQSNDSRLIHLLSKKPPFFKEISLLNSPAGASIAAGCFRVQKCV